MKLIRKHDMREGRWRNGLGVSWDIAQWPQDAGSAFGWRLATALIETDVPFSAYPGVDRYFTLIEGDGLDLDFDGGKSLAVDRLFVPHFYPCDVGTLCRVRAGPCRALNLFLRRGGWSAEVDVVQGTQQISHVGSILLFALDGAVSVDGQVLGPGDAAVTDGKAQIDGGLAHLYVARLSG